VQHMFDEKITMSSRFFFFLTNFTVSLKANVRPNVFQEPRKDVTLTNLSLYTHISWSECKPVLRATFRVGEKSYGGARAYCISSHIIIIFKYRPSTRNAIIGMCTWSKEMIISQIE
jgi:hypothetical protein